MYLSISGRAFPKKSNFPCRMSLFALRCASVGFGHVMNDGKPHPHPTTPHATPNNNALNHLQILVQHAEAGRVRQRQRPPLEADAALLGLCRRHRLWLIPSALALLLHAAEQRGRAPVLRVRGGQQQCCSGEEEEKAGRPVCHFER